VNIGNGTYGTVIKALNKSTRETVAIKKMKRKYETWEDCMALREIKALRQLKHKNVIKLKEVIRVGTDLYLVFEYCAGTILDLIRETQRFRGHKGLPEDLIKQVIR
jgi:serine/threonine protein kinase